MDENGFREFIKDGKGSSKDLSENTIRSYVRIVKEFERLLAKRGKNRQFANAKERDVKGFVRYLMRKNRANSDSLIGLLRYARFSRNNDAVRSLLEIVNSDQLPLLYKSFVEEYGRGVQSKILGGFEPPPIGTSAKRMPKATSEFMTRLESGIGEEATREFLKKYCPDTGPPEHYSDERALFLASKDVDDYLRKRRRRFMKELQGH